MKKNTTTDIKNIHKIILAFGLFCTLCGIFSQILVIKKRAIDFPLVLSITVSLIGAFFLYLACIKKTSMWKFMTGLFLTLSGIFFLVVETCFSAYNLAVLWPVLVSFVGISVIFGAVFSKKKITFSIVIPSVLLIFMGILYLLFSLDIVKISFISVVTNLLPFVLILSGAVLLGVFFYVQSGRQHIRPDLVEDNDED